VSPWFDLQLDALNSCLFTYNTFIELVYAFRALTMQTVTIPEAAHVQLRRGPPDDEQG